MSANILICTFFRSLLYYHWSLNFITTFKIFYYRPQRLLFEPTTFCIAATLKIISLPSILTKGLPLNLFDPYLAGIIIILFSKLKLYPHK